MEQSKITSFRILVNDAIRMLDDAIAFQDVDIAQVRTTLAIIQDMVDMIGFDADNELKQLGIFFDLHNRVYNITHARTKTQEAIDAAKKAATAYMDTKEA